MENANHLRAGGAENSKRIVTQRGRPAGVRAPFGQGYAPAEFGAAHAPFFLDVLCHPQVPYSFTSPPLLHGVRMAVEQPPDVLSAAPQMLEIHRLMLQTREVRDPSAPSRPR